jgi:hypothetical protein
MADEGHSDLGADEIIEAWFDAVSLFGFCTLLNNKSFKGFGSDVTCHGAFTGVVPNLLPFGTKAVFSTLRGRTLTAADARPPPRQPTQEFSQVQYYFINVARVRRYV